jgi:hypothetical protein
MEIEIETNLPPLSVWKQQIMTFQIYCRTCYILKDFMKESRLKFVAQFGKW